MPKIADLTISIATLETIERRHIYRALRATKGNLAYAARLLGIDRRTLYRRLEKWRAQNKASVVFQGIEETDNETDSTV